MNNPPLPNIPWEERPAGNSDVVWRYSANPIIPRDLIPSSNSILNSAVVPFEGRFAGVFRCDNKKREMNLNRGFSENGIDWELDNDPIQWGSDDPEIGGYQYRYDPRVVWIEDRFYVTWCNGYHGPTIGIGYTLDFQEFTFLENALLPFNRNDIRMALSQLSESKLVKMTAGDTWQVTHLGYPDSASQLDFRIVVTGTQEP